MTPLPADPLRTGRITIPVWRPCRHAHALRAAAIALAAAAAFGCAEPDAPASADVYEPGTEVEVAPPSAGALLEAAIAGEQRTDDERARDAWRHPKETLEFFGVEPWMNVVEVWPGAGWYTNILAPYLAAGGGAYIAAHLDPARSERTAAAVAAFEEKFATDPKTYGDVTVTVLGGKESDMAPEVSADAVLTFRNVHNWIAAGTAEAMFEQFHAALKPGGVLGVVEHRADSPDTDVSTGYVTEAAVKALAEGAGFVFEASSEINANPADDKDHPFGVWTLPPVRRSSASAAEEPAADFDRAAFDAIGESDRMTLRFRKPAVD